MASNRISPTAAIRMARQIRTTTRRQPFSIIARIRQAAREFEPHPFERYPTSTKAAPADWGKQVRKVGDGALFFFPFFAVVLGWPLVGEAILDGHMS